LKSKIERAVCESPSLIVGDGVDPFQLSFTFSVVSDDGNLPTVFGVGASELL